MARRHALTLAALVVLVLAVAIPAADAQMRSGTAEVTRAAGRVEVLRKGQTQWGALTTGTRLAEGDQVRAFAGGSADLAFPDGSTVLVAENTRFNVTKVDYDAQSGARNMAVHLAVGKVRAQVSQAAVQLVRARQSNFTITSPQGVAAVRGTIVIFAYDPVTQQGLLFSLPSPGQPAAVASVTYFNFATNTTTVVTGNQFISVAAAALPTAPASFSSLPGNVQQEVLGAGNPGTANSPVLTTPTVVIVTPEQIQAAITTIGIQTTAAPPTPGPPLGAGLANLPTIGQDLVQGCASPPCP
ncbi:MAG: FecR domain-containing protein [Candidatus Rokubacteria bacterium]|nr:FecR domain-containing protein [Candidatus Rokubacteria bacterium]